MKILVKIFAVLFVLSSCSGSSDIEVFVTDEVINKGYLGNGVEWDPYDEAQHWGNALSESDWEKLYQRMDFMRPGYVRCMINSPFRYFDSSTGKYERTRNAASLLTLLDYCQKNGVYVVYGEYNPTTWEMKDSEEWVKMSVDYLNWLVNEKGYDCIKQFVIFNEPDGNWSSVNGNYSFWLSMAERFYAEMSNYEGLTDKVKLAGPDVVMGYRNKASEYDAEGWVAAAAKDIDSKIGLYDVHSYPGQKMVRSGEYAERLRSMRSKVPADKKIILGESGYKYQSDPADSLLWKEYLKRCQGHPYTKGSDCNMLVYDYFYGIDMPLLAMEAMNNGFSGLAAWMLDDAMHSNGDSGKTEDIKIWGMGNILGEEVFGDASQEEIRPWYYTWALMCRYFPKGSDIVKINMPEYAGVKLAAAVKDDGITVAAVNFSEKEYNLSINLPKSLTDGILYRYEEDNIKVNSNGLPTPAKIEVKGSEMKINLAAQTFVLLTDMK